jgi:CRP-like cAMP-binding protein
MLMIIDGEVQARKRLPQTTELDSDYIRIYGPGQSYGD